MHMKILIYPILILLLQSCTATFEDQVVKENIKYGNIENCKNGIGLGKIKFGEKKENLVSILNDRPFNNFLGFRHKDNFFSSDTADVFYHILPKAISNLDSLKNFVATLGFWNDLLLMSVELYTEDRSTAYNLYKKLNENYGEPKIEDSSSPKVYKWECDKIEIILELLEIGAGPNHYHFIFYDVKTFTAKRNIQDLIRAKERNEQKVNEL